MLMSPDYIGTTKHLWRGYSPLPYPDFIGIRFAQNDIPHTLLEYSSLENM
jgi:hypothetical protein